MTTNHPFLHQGISILRAQLKTPGSVPLPSTQSAIRPFLTISREACAGATTIGHLLLPLLNEQLGEEDRSWMLLDKNLLTHALTQHHLPEALAAYLPEDRISELKGMIGEFVGLHPPLWELEHSVSQAIHQIARSGRVIFVGRAAHLITRGLPGGFHLRLVAPRETRVIRFQRQQDCDTLQAAHALDATDTARRRFVQSNFEEDPGDPHAYDLVINTDRISANAAANLVLTAMRECVAQTAAPAG